MSGGIECACSIEQGDGGYENDIQNEEIRTARKAHVCIECRDTIAPSQQYEYTTILSDGAWSHYKTCLPCMRIRREHCCAWVYGGLVEAIWEGLGFDYLTGDLAPWAEDYDAARGDGEEQDHGTD